MSPSVPWSARLDSARPALSGVGEGSGGSGVAGSPRSVQKGPTRAAPLPQASWRPPKGSNDTVELGGWMNYVRRLSSEHKDHRSGR